MSRDSASVLVVLALFCAFSGTVSGAIVTQGIPYQGTLTDSSGNPLTGTYSVTFRLYDVATGGTALATDTHSVTTTQGLFTTTLTFNPQYFDGRALWLGVKVGSDAEMTPRQPLQPVPYALGLRPGAQIIGDATTNPSIRVVNTGTDSAALIAGTTGQNSPALFANAQGPDSPAVYGWSWNNIGVYGVGQTGGYFTTSQGGSSSEDKAAVNISTVYDFNPGVEITTGGIYSNAISVLTKGYQADAVYIDSESDIGAGVNVHMRKAESVGIHAVTYLDDSIGVFGMSEGADCTGVEAYSTGTHSPGMVTNTRGPDSPALNGSTTNVNSPGILLTTGGDHSDGIVIETGGSASDGIVIKTRGYASEGLVIDTSTSLSDGLNVTTHAIWADGINVTTEGSSSVGIRVVNNGIGDVTGIESTCHQGKGVWGVSENDVGVYGETYRTDHMYGVMTRDYMSAARYDTNAGDVAEYMPVTGDLAPGTVLVISEDGTLQESLTAYDTRVAGIVSTEPGMILGVKENGNTGEALIAVAGRVPCKVDASNGPIHPGDLLTTSDRPGYAMKAEPIEIGGITFYPSGIVLGKAMGSLESGTGVIEVIVTLQ